MNVVKIPLSQLRKPDRNVRLHSAKQIEEFKRSVTMFGQIRPIVCDESYTMLAGNGLYEALMALGWKEADCYIVSGLSETEKKKLMLADNRIFSLGVDDLAAFDDIIAELENDFDIPGYDPDLLKTISIDLGGADDIMAGYGIIDTGTKQEMKKAEEKYQQAEQAAVDAAVEYRPQTPVATTPVASSSPTTTREAVTSAAESPLETPPAALERRYIVCPKCGERIWL